MTSVFYQPIVDIARVMIRFPLFMVARLLSKGAKVFDSQQHTILSAASVIGVIYSFSAALGFIRNRLLSTYFGDSAELGIFFAADDIPGLVFSIIVSGSLSAAFIPVFTRYYKRNKLAAWELTSSLINISIILFLICLVIIWGGGYFIASNILARNSSLNDSEILLLANLMRIMMFAQIIFIFSSIYTSILHSFKRFIVPAMAPVMLNIGVITFLVLFYKPLGIYAPAYGTIFGAMLHMLIQLPSTYKLGFKYALKLDIKNKGVREVYRLMIPRTVGQVANRLLDPLYTNLALFISGASNVVLTFAFDLQSLPLRIFGMSLGQAALPMLTHAYEDQDLSGFKKILIKTLHQVVFLVLPMSILMFVLRVPLVRISVGASKYSWESTVMTAYTLAFFSASLVAQALVLILARGFFALHDTKTPLKIGLGSLAINAMFAILFVKSLYLGVWSLSLAYAIGSIINCLFLFIMLMNRIGGLDFAQFMRPINRMGIAALIMGIALYVPLKVMEAYIFDTTRTLSLLILTIIVSIIGGTTYLIINKLFKVEEVGMLIRGYRSTKEVIRKM